MKVHGTSDKSPVVYAIEGDFVTTVFMILDETEKTGWEDRNSKREYFAHCDSMVAREKSLLRAIELLSTVPILPIFGLIISKIGDFWN